jgi:RNA polymerase sporulation-specific sigma factor
MHLRKVSKIKGEISFDEPLNVDYEGNELLLSDVLGTDPEIVYKKAEESEELKILKSALEKLNSREQEIMRLRYGLSGNDELTQKEVADLLRISQSYISRLEKKIVENLRKHFGK